MVLDAEKIVESEVVPMYSIEFTYDASRDAWASEFQGPNAHGARSYVVHGNEMMGPLVDLPSIHLVRHVHVRRD